MLDQSMLSLKHSVSEKNSAANVDICKKANDERVRLYKYQGFIAEKVGSQLVWGHDDDAGEDFLLEVIA